MDDSERDLLLHLLEEIEEEEEIMMTLLNDEARNMTEAHPIFKTRTEEGFFNILINQHLLKDEKKNSRVL